MDSRGKIFKTTVLITRILRTIPVSLQTLTNFTIASKVGIIIGSIVGGLTLILSPFIICKSVRKCIYQKFKSILKITLGRQIRTRRREQRRLQQSQRQDLVPQVQRISGNIVVHHIWIIPGMPQNLTVDEINIYLPKTKYNDFQSKYGAT